MPTMYQVYPRPAMDDVLAGRTDGGEHMPLHIAQQRIADLTGVSTNDAATWWRARDRRTGRGRVYIADRHGRGGYILAPAMPRLPQDGPTLFVI